MQPNLLYVQAAPGLKLPKEGEPYSYITDAEPVAVPACHYYRKAILDGDLVELTGDQWAAFVAARAKTESAAVKASAKEPAPATGAV